MAEHDVTVSTTIAAVPDRVWDAMTAPAAVEQWMMGAHVESSWEQGAEIRWSGEFNGKPYTDTGKILEVDPGTRLVHTHASSMSDGDPHVVSWTLDPAGDDATTLTLVQHGAASDAEAEQFETNWTSMLESLRDVAEAGVGR